MSIEGLIAFSTLSVTIIAILFAVFQYFEGRLDLRIKEYNIARRKHIKLQGDERAKMESPNEDGSNGNDSEQSNRKAMDEAITNYGRPSAKDGVNWSKLYEAFFDKKPIPPISGYARHSIHSLMGIFVATVISIIFCAVIDDNTLAIILTIIVVILQFYLIILSGATSIKMREMIVEVRRQTTIVRNATIQFTEASKATDPSKIPLRRRGDEYPPGI